MNIVLYDSSLELIPKEIYKCKHIQNHLKKIRKNQDILDAIYAKSCINKLKDAEKRGRPDIVHRVLLSILDHPINKLKLIENIYIHTIKNRWFYVNPQTKLPRNYSRFKGLMLKVLLTGKSSEKPLIYEINEPKIKNLIVLDENGKNIKNLEEVDLNKTIVVGGFPKGKFSKKFKGEKISVFNEPISASSAISLYLSFIYFSL